MTTQKLFVHIGTHKTATTSIQRFMAVHRRELAAQGFLYPATSRPPFPTAPRHNSILRAARLSRYLEEERRALREEMDRSGAHSVVISEEGFSNFSSEVIHFLEPFFNNCEVNVICFLRRQDLFAEALFGQKSREGKEARPFGLFVKSDDVLERLDYFRMLSMWTDAGVKSIAALDFDARVRSSDPVKVFLEVIGLDMPVNMSKTHTSPDARISVLCNFFNRNGISYDVRSIDTASRWLQSESAVAPDKALFSVNQRQAFVDFFRETNDRLAEVFGVRFGDIEDDLRNEFPVSEVVETEFLMRLIGHLSEVDNSGGGTR